MTMHSRCFLPDELSKIFSFESPSSDRLISRENSRLEFKESFSLGSADEYAKTGAAFANAQGGYIVFGVKDSPRQLIGLKTTNFETFDSAKLTSALNERFSPEIRWGIHIAKERGLKIGIIYFEEAIDKPVICTKDGGCLLQGTIYYRYRGRSQAIRYSELRRIFDEEKTRERELWMRQLRRINEVGVSQVAILNLQSGEVSGAKGNFYVSEDLLPKLQFIREGHFVENGGAPALRLLGDLHSTEGPVVRSTVQVPKIIREPEIISAFLKRESSLSPTEYLKSICFEQSYFLPVYFFIQQTTETIAGTIDFLNGLDVRGNARDNLVKRLLMPQEKLTIGKLAGSSKTAAELKAIVDQLRTRTLKQESIATNCARSRFFEALTHMNEKDFDQDYVFSLLVENILPSLSHINGLTRTTFRKAICHLDIIWYRPLLT